MRHEAGDRRHEWISCLTHAASCLLLFLAGCATADRSHTFKSEKLKEIDHAIEQAIAEHKLPGGVLWIERNGAVYHRAYGNRALVQAVEVMTEDTIFDVASITKVTATAPAIWILIERGNVELDAPVSRYIPEFHGGWRDEVTVRHLLTHTSGLRPDLDLDKPWSGYDTAIQMAIEEMPLNRPGYVFRYSDINFELLGEIVRRVSGQPLDEFAAREIFWPLRMRDTRFNPRDVSRVAPTERVACPQPSPVGSRHPLPQAGEGLSTRETLLTATRGEEPALSDANPERSEGEAESKDNRRPDEGRCILRGVVHDPTARRMGGVAGHAGLFTTARDLANYARALLNGGNGILKPETVKRMTTVQSPPNVAVRRAGGFDLDSGYSRPRGDLFPIGSFGHTGFTGGFLWIDPFSRTFYVFLANRVHSDGKGNVLALQRRLGTLIAEASGIAPPSRADPSLTLGMTEGRFPHVVSWVAGGADASNGIDVLHASGYRALQELRVGLITNHTGIDRAGNPTIDLLRSAPGVQLVALFTPEHGIRGALDEKISDTVDPVSGLPIYSLYGERRKPAPEQLANLDALVFDIQDIGTRFYTYISTLGLAMEASAPAKIKFVVLDRVNPIGGVASEGPIAEGESVFVSYHPIVVRHGMTVGELARMYKDELHIDVDLDIVKLRGWKREMWQDDAGLPWINTSPNMRSLTAAALYPGIGILERAISVGRGTATPFELAGAPYIEPDVLAREMTALALPGIRFEPIRFTPNASVFKDQLCGGLHFVLTERKAFQPVRTGIALAVMLQRLYPKKFELDKLDSLLRHHATLEAIRDGKSLEEIVALWHDDQRRFTERRATYLMY